MVIRDFYLGAWLIKEHGYQYQIANGKVDVAIDKSSLATLTKDYNAHHKDYYDCVKQLIKEANQSRAGH